MALIVEDGTGRADAESYLSVVAFKAYCDAWGYDYTGKTDAVIEQKLRIASNYIDTKFRYKGSRLQASQLLEWPRSSCIDWSGFTITGVPPRVAKATAELAFKAFTESLHADLDRGGRAVSESVGPISVSYAADAPAGKLYAYAKGLLDPFIRDPAEPGSPLFTANDSPYFSLTRDDYPGTTDPVVE